MRIKKQINSPRVGKVRKSKVTLFIHGSLNGPGNGYNSTSNKHSLVKKPNYQEADQLEI